MFVYSQQNVRRPDRRKTRRIMRYRLHCTRNILSEHKNVAQNKKTIASLGPIRLLGNQVPHKNTTIELMRQIFRDDESGRPNRTHKIIPANKIAWTNKIIRANKIARTIKINRTNKIIWTNKINRIHKIARTVILRLYSSKSSTRSDGYLTVIERLHYSKSSTRSDGYLTVIEQLHYSKSSTRSDVYLTGI